MTLRISSAAKINLVLSVLGKRRDDYHELRTILQSVSLYDTLEFARAERLEIDAPAGITEQPEQNLVYRAAEIFLQKYAPAQGVKITLTKKIPLAAGLAGGSADCAGALLGLNKFLAVNLPLAELDKIANQLGSDIAYCLRGGAYLALGRGEMLRKIPELPRLYGLILKPPFALSTAEVYRAYRPAGVKIFADDAYIEGKISPENLPTHNALWPAAGALQPELPAYRQILKATNPIACSMSGSGAALFAFYNDKITRDKAAVSLYGRYEIYPIETINSAQTISEN
ncbi:4-diphosphocytidyl-2C-methyl-D-erythritol kinase [Candidatus Termititenax aidoneus]|uniref:4-diphosphocytidyl-2-C-methyl-D-erythritol kinase n=1 Tax=Termititenax aidoneus TaxID=2218524 RepID=A0A388TA30_TERA1|nr:4-diphosphocytidyl-2C-methyl-D-erythritol kinase [Candidatus Termititenax aidoneus]